MASCKILVFNGRRCHFIHQFMANRIWANPFKKDLTVGLILKHYEQADQAKRIRKGIFVKILGKLRTLAMIYPLGKSYNLLNVLGFR